MASPDLVGYTEQARMVKRSVTVTPVAGRRRWDQASYFADAAAKITPSQVVDLRSLLDHFIGLRCEIGWGTGVQKGSFNIKDPIVCPRSFRTCYSNGDLSLNTNWLDGSDLAGTAQQQIRELTSETLKLPADRPIPIAQWSAKLLQINSGLQQVLERCRALGAQAQQRSNGE